MSGMASKPPMVQFNLLKCLQNGMVKITEEMGPKILLLDEATQDALSMACSFSDMLQKDLYLIDMLRSPKRQKQGHLKAVVFIRPTLDNVNDLKRELRTPLYAEYFIYFTNIVSEDMLQDIARADEYEIVKQVHELFCDYFPLSPHAYTLDIEKPLLRGSRDVSDAQKRCVEGLQSVLLSLRRKPMIRYQRNSEGCRVLAEALGNRMQEESSLFEFRRTDESLVMIIDRTSDMLTPLLTQWTYEAMVHEEFGITKQKTKVPVETGKVEEINLAPAFDSFWSDNLHTNWGDLCINVKNIVESYKEKSSAENRDSKTANLEDLKKFMDKIPELRKESITMGKHTSIAAELGRVIRRRKLLEVSSLEQDLCCSNTHKEHVDRMYALLDDDTISGKDLLRLVMLYAVRWERTKDNQVDRFKSRLLSRGVPEVEVNAVTNVVRYGGAHVNGDLIDNDRKLTSILRAAVKGMQDVENIYTQHDPHLKKIVQNALKGKLSAESFPYVSAYGQPTSPGKLKEFIIFYVGGVTHEETKIAATLMAENPGLRVVIGGTDVLRTADVVQELSGEL
eukprot:TRINITY_DN25771_c0_g1_i1.p1 TRINITY_DN25771_c0_g1~~TRINITY_DN25771_c0_g1_i1.p1  ORF type:complete len:576 (+),score=194.67 TRINITY_DN25771_c0_g1_i1:37-1728(+)